MHSIKKLAAAVAAAGLAAGAQADALYSNDFGGTVWSTSVSQAVSFAADSGAAAVYFRLNGFKSLDGDGDYVDIFTLKVNGSAVFSGTWDLGGGGTDRVLSAPVGTTLHKSGHGIDVVVPVSLTAGSNSLSFSYDSPTWFEGSGRAGPQDLDDEGWSLGKVSVTAVPEPGSAVLLLAGVGLLGAVVRRRR